MVIVVLRKPPVDFSRAANLQVPEVFLPCSQHWWSSANIWGATSLISCTVSNQISHLQQLASKANFWQCTNTNSWHHPVKYPWVDAFLCYTGAIPCRQVLVMGTIIAWVGGGVQRKQRHQNHKCQLLGRADSHHWQLTVFRLGSLHEIHIRAPRSAQWSIKTKCLLATPFSERSKRWFRVITDTIILKCVL